MLKTILTKTELEIMQYIWSINSEITAADIRLHFSDKKWSKQSVSFFLKNLVKANYLNVRCESMTKYYYSAVITEQEYSLLPVKEILKKEFNNSISKFACTFFSDDATEDDIRELENLIVELQEKIANNQGKNGSI